MPKAKDDLGLVIRAAQFAAQKHKDQRRKDVKATPYINHPINLAEVLHTDGGVHDPIVIAAALALPLGVAAICGSVLGSRLAMRGGNQWIRRLFLILAISLLCKLLWETVRPWLG